MRIAEKADKWGILVTGVGLVLWGVALVLLWQVAPRTKFRADSFAMQVPSLMRLVLQIPIWAAAAVAFGTWAIGATQPRFGTRALVVCGLPALALLVIGGAVWLTEAKLAAGLAR